ncbi:hypothetical protein NDU88_001372 [Pleurodeles waltl]|uniref:Uncharacterized protein n=1 Tax=Pleurodeles waltl TaxID=8319 RepID=A0AAV7M0X2_PLEWA|nr:hypothetical protein NDU88_001372 [Pleurodeles waltl]
MVSSQQGLAGGAPVSCLLAVRPCKQTSGNKQPESSEPALLRDTAQASRPTFRVLRGWRWLMPSGPERTGNPDQETNRIN